MSAFRIRFSGFQERLGKTMRTIVIEEEQNVNRFDALLAFIERLIIEPADHWKLVRELRNAFNPDREDARLADFFKLT